MSFHIPVRDITWTGAIKSALEQVDVGTCTSDTFKASRIQELAKCAKFLIFVNGTWTGAIKWHFAK